jgi:hypothetical protein
MAFWRATREKGVYNFLQRTRSREDAEELCQESFARVAQASPTYDGVELRRGCTRRARSRRGSRACARAT